MDYVVILFIIVAGIVLAGFFSGYETGVYCLNRARLRLRLEQGSRSARGVDALIANMQQLVGTTLVGTNVALYAASAAVTELLVRTRIHTARPQLYATIIIAPLLFIFAEVLPKNYSRKNADDFAYRYYRAIYFFYWLLYAPTLIVTGIGRALSAVLGRRAEHERQALDESEILFYISEGLEAGQISPFQSLAARNVFALTTKALRQIMVPLERVAAVPETATIAQVKAIVAQKRLSRLPVYRDNPANVIGKIHVLELPFRGADNETVAPYVHPVIKMPEDSPIDAALTRLQAARSHMAIITATDAADAPATGIVTLKDIVEEIVGELRVW
jgi:CBS domain containing-hemolysin-like protein